jgi:hypothetical protein
LRHRNQKSAGSTADIEQIRNEDNEEATAIVSNPGLRLVIDGKCTAAQSIVKGGVYAINEVYYLCEAAVNRHSPTLTRFSATFYKPDGATYT